MTTTLYVEPMQDHLLFAFVVDGKAVAISGRVADFRVLIFLHDALKADDFLIGPAFRSDEVKRFSAIIDIPFPATLEQRKEIEQFINTTPQ